MAKKFKVIVAPGSMLLCMQAVEGTLKDHLPDDFRWQKANVIGWDARKDGYEIYRKIDGKLIAKIDGFSNLSDIFVWQLDELDAIKAFAEHLAEAIQSDVKITTA